MSTYHPGDRKLGHGDHDTHENSSGVTIQEGEFVSPDGTGGILPIDAATGDDTLLGIVQDTVEPGDTVMVSYRGLVYGLVEADVTAGVELVAPDTGTDGEPGVAAAGTVPGAPTITENPEQNDDGDYVAPVLLR
jgi:hypothetical protein